MSVTNMARICVCFVAMSLASGVCMAGVKLSTLEKQKWISVETENFRIITDRSKNDALKLASNLERFRKAFEIVFGVSVEEDQIALKVIATKRSNTYRTFTEDVTDLKRTGGFFTSSNSGNYAVIESSGRIRSSDTMPGGALKILYHEYVHYLMASLYPRLPLWANEGYAEFLETISFKNERVVNIGVPQTAHLSSIRANNWLKMEQVLNASHIPSKERRDRERLYSQGWLMVHYFLNNRERSNQLRDLLLFLVAGQPISEALKRSTNLSYAELDRELRKYAETEKWRYSEITLKKPFDVKRVEVANISPSDLLFEFGEFFLKVRSDSEKAAKYFNRSIELNDQNARSWAGLAGVSMNRGNLEDAQLKITNALSIDSEDWFVKTLAGHVSLSRLLQADDLNEKARYRALTIRHYNDSIRMNPPNPESLVASSQLYLSEGNFDRVVEILELAHEYVPGAREIKTKLINACLANADIPCAEHYARLVTRNHGLSDQEVLAFEKWFVALKEEYTKRKEEGSAELRE